MHTNRLGLASQVRSVVLGSTAVVLAQLSVFTGSAQAQTVDKMIFLSLDVSGSVDTTEYNTERLGWSNAFLLPSIKSSIASSSNGIAVAVGQWDTIARTPLSIDWTHLTDAASVDAFAAQLASINRQGSGSTCLSCGMNAAIDSIQATIASGLYNSATRIIDVSGDGIENVTSDTSVQSARDLAVSNGIRINGLAIEGDFGPSGVTDYYANNVITPGGFVQTVTGFTEFQTAANLKLGREVKSEVPGPLPVIGVAAGFGWTRRLRKRIGASKVGNMAST
jgi:hypothetical protein